MKFIALLVFLVSSSVMAMPAINDTASFNVIVTSGAQTMTGTIDMTLVSFDAASQMFTQRQTSVFNGGAQTQESKVASQNFLTDAQIEMVLGNCAMINGTAENVSVLAGNFKTCRILSQDGQSTYWIGHVPFLVVKALGKQQGMDLDMQLKSYSMGQ